MKRVSLVGAGPGDLGLLTLRAQDRIQSAEVVLYDRFVSPVILALIPDQAERIDVGKVAGYHKVPQEQINQLILQYALEGKQVVRLKGGDPFVFGRGGEELAVLAAHQVPFEVIPGISSAIAGPAYAGIPVTHRNLSSSFHVITAQGKQGEKPDINYQALAQLSGSLVFLMAVAVVDQVAEGCLQAGMAPETPVAVIENATLSQQREFVGQLSGLVQLVHDQAIQSPAIIIVGAVSQLAKDLAWRHGVLTGQRILVARTKPGLSQLSEELRKNGASVSELPPARIEAITGATGLDLAVRQLATADWLVFTSAVGVTVLFDHLKAIQLDVRQLSHLKLAAVGPKTAQAVLDRGLLVDLIPADYHGQALAQQLMADSPATSHYLIVRAKDGSPDLTNQLSQAGRRFTDVAVYTTERPVGDWTMPDFDLAVFTSSAAVEWFLKANQGRDLSQAVAVCIGDRTRRSAEGAFGQIIQSPQATSHSLVETIKEYCHHGL